MDKGFITISREIKTHWICDNPLYFRAWIFMLMTANYKDGKLLLGSKVYKIKRGQASLSIRSWANEFNMSTKAVDTFFNLLVEDGMIKRQKIGSGKQSTTLITIENYNNYQLWIETQEKREGNMRETQEKHEGNARGVQYNKDNKGNKENKEEIIIPSYDDFKKHAFQKLNDKGVDNVFLYEFDIKAKYEQWVENEWRDGYNKPILNWKSTLTNQIKYDRIKPVKQNNQGRIVSL